MARRNACAYTDPMLGDLLREAREQAALSAPPIKSAALVHIARVLTTIDRGEAEHVLDEGLALAASLPEDERDVLLGEGVVLAATVSPARALALLPGIGPDRASIVTQMLARMVDHGYAAEAVEYLTDPASTIDYPFGMVLHAIGRSSDDELKRRVLRRAIQAMRELPAGRLEPPPFGWHDFTTLFTFYWRLLPEEEARVVLREIVDRILSEPNHRTNAGFGAGAHDVRFTSTHEQQLFEILEPMQHLDPEFAVSVISRYPQLSCAAFRFPYGQASMTAMMAADEAATPAEPSPETIADMDAIDTGHRFIPIREAIRTEFSEAFAAALDEYDEDTDPANVNEVPRQCWSSAAAFRNILFKAGQHEGAAAARYLERVPDPALKLLAQIELAAALAGLPQLGWRTMRRGARTRRDEARAGVQGALAGPRIDPSRFELAPPRKPDLPPSRQLRVTPATAPADEGPSGGSGPDFVEIRNATLKGVVSELYDTPPARIEWPASLDPDARYDFVLVLPREESAESRTRLLRDGINAHFGLRISVENVPKDVWILTAPNGITCRERRTESASQLGSMSFQVTTLDASPRMPEAMRLHQIMDPPIDASGMDPAAMFERMRREIARQFAALTGAGTSIAGLEATLSIQDLCTTVESGLDRPLVDETNLRGTYVIAVEADEERAGDFLHRVAGRLGLVVQPGRREVRLLVIQLNPDAIPSV
jgi:uncharacterized protein (TIGR03435 family)